MDSSYLLVMERVIEKTTSVGLGFATGKNAFQCGREAAQMALHQFSTRSYDLVLVFHPDDMHFNNFVEGARLVVNEEKLLAIPSPLCFTNQLPMARSGVVLILKSTSAKFCLASVPATHPNPFALSTALHTQFRNARGSLRNQVPYQNFLLFENSPISEPSLALPMSAADAGGDCHFVGITVSTQAPLMCRDQAVPHGLVGFESLSQTPWGVGLVTLSPFLKTPRVTKEAVLSAFREALSHLNNVPAACGLLFINNAKSFLSENELKTVFEGVNSPLNNFPIVGSMTQHQCVKLADHSFMPLEESVIALVVPE